MRPKTLNPNGNPIQYQCRHIKTDGNRCGSPALRQEHFCYYHHTTRRPGPRQPQVQSNTARRSSTFDLPSPSDLAERSGVQLAIALLLHKIAHNEIDPRRAGLLLYGLQIASTNISREVPKKSEDPEIIEEVIADPTHGSLAPEAEWEKHQEKGGTLTRVLRELERQDQEEAAAKERGEQTSSQKPCYPVVIPSLDASFASRFRESRNRPDSTQTRPSPLAARRCRANRPRRSTPKSNTSKTLQENPGRGSSPTTHPTPAPGSDSASLHRSHPYS